jgi:hypothetical protein
MSPLCHTAVAREENKAPSFLPSTCLSFSGLSAAPELNVHSNQNSCFFRCQRHCNVTNCVILLDMSVRTYVRTLSQTFVAKGRRRDRERRTKDPRNNKRMENRPVPREKEVATAQVAATYSQRLTLTVFSNTYKLVGVALVCPKHWNIWYLGKGT